MRKGFIFNHDKCVGCRACSAACILENGWTVEPRTIFTYNPEVISALPLVNLSLACNHCEKPVCLEGCPAGSYYREPVTGAIVIDETKCLGCKYCQWNCPYDAPKFDTQKRIIGKCNLCYSGLVEGRLPACVNACPTGALEFGDLFLNNELKNPLWFPDTGIGPALELKGQKTSIPLKIIPGKIFEKELSENQPEHSDSKIEWSLVLFSFLATLSVSVMTSSLIKGVFPDLLFSVSIIILTGIVSLFHLGRLLRGWRALSNLKTSPLSREIAAFIVYSAVSLTAMIFQLPFLLIVASVSGLILLLAIDQVYKYSDSRKLIFFHSGQTFLSSLIMVSFFTENLIPFCFIAILKLSLIAYNLKYFRSDSGSFGIRFMRVALLLIAGISIISGNSYTNHVIIALFLIGELFDRIIFYLDFEPLSISNLIYKHINAAKNEEKRG